MALFKSLSVYNFETFDFEEKRNSDLKLKKKVAMKYIDNEYKY